MRNRAVIWIVLLAVPVLTLIWIAGGSDPLATAAGLAPRLVAGPDLKINSITLIPTYPGVGQSTAIRVEVKNAGTAAAGAFTTTLYIDLPGPPNEGTPSVTYFYLFGLGAGKSTVFTYNYPGWSSAGCGHNVWAWAQHNPQEWTDADPTNDKGTVEVCAGTTPTPTNSPPPPPTNTPTPPPPCQQDSYEPADNSCGGATSITTNGVHQMHSLCPITDTDWVKFTASASVTYTLATVNVGADGDTVLELYNQCNEPPLALSDPAFGNGAQIEWQADTTGVYYLKVKHHAATYGQQNGYELFVQASTDCADDSLEPDDACNQARDLAPGAAPQAARFCKPADEDWRRFTASSGATYAITATATGPDAVPLLALYDQCGYEAPLRAGSAFTYTVPSAGTYYLKVQHQNPAVYGPNASYTAQLRMTQCGPDGYEGDNSPASVPVVYPLAEQAHDFCPLGDQDWIKFQATQGQLYVMQTYDLGSDADTKICLFGTDATTQLGCDDDGGGGVSSRLAWTAPAAGNYYLRVENLSSGSSGPKASYRLSISVGEPVDAFEPDNSAVQAQTILTDGTVQNRNFTPAGDEDWVKFNVSTTSEPYVLRAACAGLECDAVLHLIDRNGTTPLADNDDYGTDMDAQITFVFQQTGIYYLRVHNYMNTRSGPGTRYTLSVTRNGQAIPPTPTPPVPPTPGAPTPPPGSGVKTLIVTNSERLQALYGGTQATNVLNALGALAGDASVRGAIVDTQANTAAVAAYAAWNATASTQISSTLANNVTAAIRNQVMGYLGTNPGVEYIVIVGNDRVVPFRRVPDHSASSEALYQAFVTGGSTVYGALRDNMFLTDDYYGDQQPSPVNGREVYVPDFAIGRLPEGPAQIVNFINTYLTNNQIVLQRGLVTGYTFVLDAAQEISTTLGTDLGPAGAINGTLQNEWFTGTELREAQLNTSPPYQVQAINGHADRHNEGAPQGGAVSDGDVASYGSADLRRSLIFTPGCHSGLNDVGGTGTGSDLAEAFFGRGANYIGNTGYGYGSPFSLGWSERLMQLLAQNLAQGASTPIGKALMLAKQQYFQQATDFDSADEKALQESTLYGLPQYVFISGGTLGEENPFPGVAVTTTLTLGDDPVRVGNVNLGLPGSFASLGEYQSGGGTYFGINESFSVGDGQPVLPLFYGNVTAPSAGRAHGVLFLSAHYSDTLPLPPVVGSPMNEYHPPEQQTLSGDGWLPGRPVGLSNLEAARQADTLVTQLGQYNPLNGRNRLYDGMQLQVLYSQSPDWTPPAITFLGDSTPRGAQLTTVKVKASDVTGILRGVVTWTSGGGQWQSVEMAYDAQAAKWTAQIPATTGTLYWVQVVDNAGNIAAATNKGRYYQVSAGRQTYLPVLTKR